MTGVNCDGAITSLEYVLPVPARKTHEQRALRWFPHQEKDDKSARDDDVVIKA